jgi:MSHA pilin protein MshD
MPIAVKQRRVTGYTLIELVVVIVVLSLALTGVTLVINQAVRQSPQALVQTRAMELAQTYLDEIYSKRYDENSGQGGIPRCDSSDTNAQACSNSLGSEEGSNRLLFDDVDDYDGLNEQPPTSIVDGSNLNNYDSYAVQVTVVYAGTELGFANNRHAKRVTINITTPLGNTIPVSVYRMNF